MASARKQRSDGEYLALLAQQLADLHKETVRLNRRLRDIRAAVRTVEDNLAALSADIQARLVEASDR